MNNDAFTRLDLRLINFALVYTFWLHRAHYSDGTVNREQELMAKISRLLAAAENQE